MRIQELIEKAQSITDPRRQYGYLQHKLVGIVVTAFCAIICGAEDYEDIEEFGKARKEWLEKFLDLPNGIPDKDTFRRVFERLDPQEVSECLYSWLGNRDCSGKTVNIDGKTLCGSGNSAHKAYHVVSAWVSENQITLGEIAVDEKSNEITAIPKLLDLVDVEGSTVTIDAMGCQTEIAKKIIEKEADYCISLKGNQANLHEDVKSHFENAVACQDASKNVLDSVATDGKEHGRVENRQYFLETDIGWLSQRESWQGLKAVGMVKSTVCEKNKTSVETRYFITSLSDVGKFSESVRKHWSIENQLHWQLDVAFGEDSSRTRKDNSPLNWNVMRKTALPILRKADVGKKTSIKRKMFMAALDISVLEKILF
jgi:predicted transposase YbfD/YdcC